MATLQPLEDLPNHYRELAKMWRDSAAAVPIGAPQQAIYLEIAEGYAKLAAHYERRAQVEHGLRRAVWEVA